MTTLLEEDGGFCGAEIAVFTLLGREATKGYLDPKNI